MFNKKLIFVTACGLSLAACNGGGGSSGGGGGSSGGTGLTAYPPACTSNTTPGNPLQISSDVSSTIFISNESGSVTFEGYGDGFQLLTTTGDITLNTNQCYSATTSTIGGGPTGTTVFTNCSASLVESTYTFSAVETTTIEGQTGVFNVSFTANCPVESASN